MPFFFTQKALCDWSYLKWAQSNKWNAHLHCDEGSLVTAGRQTFDNINSIPISHWHRKEMNEWTSVVEISWLNELVSRTIFPCRFFSFWSKSARDLSRSLEISAAGLKQLTCGLHNAPARDGDIPKSTESARLCLSDSRKKSKSLLRRSVWFPFKNIQQRTPALLGNNTHW